MIFNARQRVAGDNVDFQASQTVLAGGGGGGGVKKKI